MSNYIPFNVWPAAAGEGGATVHNQLTGRSTAGSHPATAVSVDVAALAAANVNAALAELAVRADVSATFFYDPDATPGGGVFDSWTDLMAAVDQAKVYGAPLVRLSSDVADGTLANRVRLDVPAGEWDFSRVIFESALPYDQVTLRCPTGVTVSSMHGLQLRRGVVVRSSSTAALMVPASGPQLLDLHHSSGLCSETEPMIDASNDGVLFIAAVDDEAGLWNGANVSLEPEGGAPIAHFTGNGCIAFVTCGQKTVVSDDVFSGHVAFYAYRNGASSVRNATITNAGFTFDFDGSLNLNRAENIGLDPTTLGLADATDIKLAIEMVGKPAMYALRTDNDGDYILQNPGGSTSLPAGAVKVFYGPDDPTTTSWAGAVETCDQWIDPGVHHKIRNLADSAWVDV